MKAARLILAPLLLVRSPLVAAGRGTAYSVTVTRKDSNLYRIDGSRLYIKTRYCYEYGYSVKATLYYEKYSYDNSLYFVQSRTTCDVEKVLSE